MKKDVKMPYSVRLESAFVEELRILADKWGLTPADLIRLSVVSLLREAKNGTLTLPFRHAELRKNKRS